MYFDSRRDFQRTFSIAPLYAHQYIFRAHKREANYRIYKLYRSELRSELREDSPSPSVVRRVFLTVTH